VDRLIFIDGLELFGDFIIPQRALIYTNVQNTRESKYMSHSV